MPGRYVKARGREGGVARGLQILVKRGQLVCKARDIPAALRQCALRDAPSEAVSRRPSVQLVCNSLSRYPKAGWAGVRERPLVADFPSDRLPF